MYESDIWFQTGWLSWVNKISLIDTHSVDKLLATAEMTQTMVVDFHQLCSVTREKACIRQQSSHKHQNNQTVRFESEWDANITVNGYWHIDHNKSQQNVSYNQDFRARATFHRV